jgi:hypothetical protein
MLVGNKYEAQRVEEGRKEPLETEKRLVRRRLVVIGLIALTIHEFIRADLRFRCPNQRNARACGNVKRDELILMVKK